MGQTVGQTVGKTECLMCHTEHKGADANIVEISDDQCATCHTKKFQSFARGHPAFSKSFPALRRTAIAYDHNSHFDTHFKNARFADKAPADCGSCHVQSGDKRWLSLVGFERACADCHGEQMASRELVAIRFPMLPESSMARDDVVEACGPTNDEYQVLVERLEALEAGTPMEADEDEEYESISDEDLSPFGAFLLDVAADDADAYAEDMQTLVLAMASEGLAPLVERLNDRAGDDVAGRLLAGLNPEVVKRAACAWAANLEYEPPAEPAMGGWYSESMELRYRPKGHADPVAASWLEFALATARDVADDESGGRAMALLDSLISVKEGVGACAKCHTVSESADGALAVEWRARNRSSRPYYRFSHDIHIQLLNAGYAKQSGSAKGCRSCHASNPDADVAAGFTDFDPMTFASSFKPIVKETCVECHSEGYVRDSCQLCHEYHREPSFKIRMTNNGG